MDYRSPFRLADVEHDSCNPLCLDVGDAVDPELATWRDCYDGAMCLISDAGEQAAFFLARHFVELSLKLLHPRPQTGHDLARLLDDLPEYEPLRVSTTSDADSIRQFILDMHHVDRTGTEGRYGVHSGGRRAFNNFCCIERDVLAEQLTHLRDYVEDRTVART